MTWREFKKIVEAKLVVQGYLPQGIENAEIDFIDMRGDDVMGYFDVYVEVKPDDSIRISIH